MGFLLLVDTHSKFPSFILILSFLLAFLLSFLLVSIILKQLPLVFLQEEVQLFLTELEKLLYSLFFPQIILELIVTQLFTLVLLLFKALLLFIF